MSIRLDFFNLPNMLNGQWGRIHQAGTNSNVPLLTVTGQTAVTNRASPSAAIPIVQFQPAYVQYPIQNNAANYYQIQLSARLDW